MEIGGENPFFGSSVINEFIDEQEFSQINREENSLERLLEYPFKEMEKKGKVDTEFNSTTRVDVIRDKKARIVRSPMRFLEFVKFIEELRGKPAIGLRYKEGSTYRYVHFLSPDISEGWIYVDNRRMLQVRDIHRIERIRDYVELDQICILANQIGMPSRREVSRINTERGKILRLRHFHTIHNKSLLEYF